MFPVRFYTYSINAALAPNIFRTSFGAVLRMNFERMKFHFTVSSCWIDGWTDSHTSLTLCISWAPDDPLAISKLIHQRMSSHTHKGPLERMFRGCLLKSASLPYRYHYIYIKKLCLNYLSIEIMGETLQSQAYIDNKILQPLFKIKHKLASLVRQQADSIPLSRVSLFTSSLTLLAVHSQTTG